MPIYVEKARKLVKWLSSARAQDADTDWAVVEHYRREWGTMSDGACANPDFYMQRMHKGSVEKRRLTQVGQDETEAYFDLKEFMTM